MKEIPGGMVKTWMDFSFIVLLANGSATDQSKRSILNFGIEIFL